MPFSFSPPRWFDVVDSTNNYLKSHAASGAARSGDVVAAHTQTNGRGRMGNRWISGAGGDLAFSFYWRGAVAPLVAGMLPVACAVAVRDFLAQPGRDVRALCKWPNDVLVDDAKICGILTESSPATDGTMGLVVGMGLNLRSDPERDRELGKKTAALDKYVMNAGTPAALLPGLLACLETRIREWEEQGTPGVLAAVRPCLWGVGREVRARTPGGAVVGKVVGLGGEGELLLETADKGEVGVPSVAALEDGWQ